MQDVFYEETATLIDDAKASRRFNIFRIISKVCYILFTIYAIILIYFFGPEENNVVFSIIASFAPLVILLVIAIVCGAYKNTLYVEYDYTFISGTIKVSKVIKNFKRRFVIKFDTYNIEKIGYYASPTYEKYQLMPGIVKKILTHNSTPKDDKDLYYIVVNVNGQKHLLIFECTKQFIINILKFSKKTVLEERFLSK